MSQTSEYVADILVGGKYSRDAGINHGEHVAGSHERNLFCPKRLFLDVHHPADDYDRFERSGTSCRGVSYISHSPSPPSCESHLPNRLSMVNVSIPPPGSVIDGSTLV